MTDRLPSPVLDEGHDAPLVERASATPAFAFVPRPVSVPMPLGEGAAHVPAAPKALRDVQTWMVATIASADADAAGVDAVVTAGPRLSARDRFEIYRFGYKARLTECLLDDYPVLGATLGEEKFRALASEYIDRYPSSSPNLNAFGRHMAALCRQVSAPLLDEPRAFYAELAALEWALVEAIHAAPAPVLDLASLQALSPDAWATARLIPSGTVKVLSFAYPVSHFFQDCRDKGAPTNIPSPCRSATAVYRKDRFLFRMDLTPAMERVLVALLAGKPIGESLAEMALDESDRAAIAEAERSVMIWFRDWALAGFFSGVTSGHWGTAG